jgi:hypothetical protein
MAGFCALGLAAQVTGDEEFPDGLTPERLVPIRGRMRILLWPIGVRLVLGGVLGGVFGAISGLLFWRAFGLAGGLAGGLAVGLTMGLQGALLDDLEDALDITTVPRVLDSLAADRNHALYRILLSLPSVGFLAVMVPLFVAGSTGRPGLIAWLVLGLILGAMGGITAGLAVGAVARLAGAWGQWLLLVRVWLPLTDRLPWRVAAFLADAHHRGILRQAGAVYQFRHSRLQDHLARTPP